MRILLALGIGVLLFGGTYLYTKLSALAVADFTQSSQVSVEEVYSVELLRTFTAIPQSENPDSEAAKDEVPTQRESIRVLFQGKPVLSRKDKTTPEVSCVVDRLDGVEAGRNEIFVCARMEPPKSGELAALHIRVRSGNRLVAEETFASQENSPLIYGTLIFDAEKPAREKP